MTDVVLASLAAATPMGQQEYERQLLAHLPAAGVSVRSVVVRSMRSTLSSDVRLPLTALTRSPIVVQNAAARAAYRTSGLVHRADLRLPAARADVVTVHDLAPLRFSDEGSIPPASLATLRHARAIICPSRFSADEVGKLTGIETAIVIHNGIDPDVWTASDPALLHGLELPDVFVLHSGGATRRKNLGGLAGAWRVLAARHPHVELVLCGPPDQRRNLLFAELPRVRMLGRVPRAMHLELMGAASVVVVPSTYEGFGFPALESMARRTAVVAVDQGALPEICGPAAVMTEPGGESLAVAISRLLTDDDEVARLVDVGVERARQFTWQAAASRHAEIYAGSLA